MAKLKSETTKEVLNETTGEVKTITTSKTFCTKYNSDKFFMTYYKIEEILTGITSVNERITGTDLRVLDYLCTLAEYNTGLISLSKNKRFIICEQLDIKYQTLSNSICNLKKFDYLKDERGDFRINPEHRWKGDAKTRDLFINNNGTMSINIEFDKEG